MKSKSKTKGVKELKDENDLNDQGIKCIKRI
jgi:hypothetical protein